MKVKLTRSAFFYPWPALLINRAFVSSPYAVVLSFLKWDLSFWRYP